MPEQTQRGMEMKEAQEKTAIVIGTLGDLGLGNPEGIPSRYAGLEMSELQEIAERDQAQLVAPEDTIHPCCIDGRCVLHNADGSEAKIRMRRVGGSAANLGVALNGDASVVQTFGADTTLSEMITAVDNLVGYRAAHQGGCGGANGEISDHEAIASNPKILEAVKAFMELEAIQQSLGFGYDEMLGERVRSNAAKTAVLLRGLDWNGQSYVDGVAKDDPAGVEVLEVDESAKHHGHKEPIIAVIVGDKTMPRDFEGFVWNLEATKAAAQKLAGQRGAEGYQQLVIAEIAKHFATSSRLASPDTPVEIIAA